MDYVSLKLDELISNYERNITLQCKDCEYIECPIVKQGTYWKGKQGCTRKVLNSIADALGVTYEQYFVLSNGERV